MLMLILCLKGLAFFGLTILTTWDSSESRLPVPPDIVEGRNIPVRGVAVVG